MGYLVVADMREATQQWFSRHLTLTAQEAPDAELTAAIAAFSNWIDRVTGDRFEPEPPSGTTTLEISSSGGLDLYVPKRIRSVTAVELRDRYGALTAQDAAVYRVSSSLTAAGEPTVEDQDLVTLIDGRALSTGATAWPTGVNVVRLTGQFGWPATPDRIKRAVAIKVWDHYRNWNPDLRRAARMTTFEGVTYELAEQFPEILEILREFTRDRLRVG